MIPLEPFLFKDNPRLEAVGVELFRVSPPPSPHGEGLSFQKVLSLHVFGRGFATCRHPRLRSVLWLARQLPVGSAALAKNLPHRSREHEFTDGRVGRFRPVKDRFVLKRVYGLRRVLTTGSD